MTVATEERSRSISWMVTYGDMITLLLTFFVLLFVMMKEAENTVYRMIERTLAHTENELIASIERSPLGDAVRVQRGTKGIQLTLSSGALFESGKADVKENLKPLLMEIGDVVNRMQFISAEVDRQVAGFQESLEKTGAKMRVEIRVEGHTDNVPINTPEYPSNWELSAARALNVVRYMSESAEIPEERFSALGYGEFRPIGPNRTERDKARNRRVEIFIDANVEKL